MLDAFHKKDLVLGSLNYKINEINKRFYMLTIACSANIGSSITFTGNPQNIIISNHLSKNMAGGMFFALLLAPAMISCIISSIYLNYNRLSTINSLKNEYNELAVGQIEAEKQVDYWSLNFAKSISFCGTSEYTENNNNVISTIKMPQNTNNEINCNNDCIVENSKTMNDWFINFEKSEVLNRKEVDFEEVVQNNENNVDSSIVIVNNEATILEDMQHKEKLYILSYGEFPEIVFTGFTIIIILEFVGLNITAIFCCISILIIVFILLGNYARRVPTYMRKTKVTSGTSSRGSSNSSSNKEIPNHVVTVEDRIQGISKYIELLFAEIDYNLIFIFIGLFIISGAFVNTKIPKVVLNMQMKRTI